MFSLYLHDAYSFPWPNVNRCWKLSLVDWGLIFVFGRSHNVIYEINLENQWSFMLFLSCFCNANLACLLLMPCSHLLVLVCDVLLWNCHFSIGILGQVWCLIVLIPDLYRLSYFGWLFSLARVVCAAIRPFLCHVANYFDCFSAMVHCESLEDSLLP